MTSRKNSISIITPCYNEGRSIILFLQSLENVLKTLTEYQFNILVVDDCSNDNTPSLLRNFEFGSPNCKLHILRNLYNTGHQNSIFQGLLYTRKLSQEYVIIMDSDGEDNPMAIPLLLEKKEFDIVEVKRKKRSEGLLFRLMYLIYKMIFRVITGKVMNYGNYCMLNDSLVEKIRFTSFIHLPAYLLKQRGKRSFIAYDRSARLEGESKMGYKELFLHAFKSFVEFGNDLLLWFLRLFGMVFLLLIGILSNLFYQKFIAHTAIPGWFSTLFIGLLNIALLCIGFFVLGILLINLMHQRINEQGPVYTVITSEGSDES
jgi:glycosyltransferase involved in cell wall biosynthesis